MTKKLGTSWGYEEMDDLIGPLSPGRLYVVGARPSNGKTTFLLNVLNAIYGTINTRPRKVLCFWTEMEPEAMLTLWAALRLGLPEDRVLMEEWHELPDGSEEAVKVLRERLAWEYREDDEGAWIRFEEATRPTAARIYELVQKHRPDIVFYDYIQKTRAAKGEDRYTAVGNMASTLHEMAVKGRCAVVVGSQLKRRGDQVFDKYRAPDLEDMKLAGEIEEAATVVLGLFRLLKPGMTRKDEEAVRAGERALAEFAISNTMAIRVLKHRYRGSAADELLRLTLDGKRVLGKYTPYKGGEGMLSPEDTFGDAYEGPA